MTGNRLYEELTRHLSAVGPVRRELGRIVPAGCSAGSAAVLAVLGRHGALRMGRLSELLDADPSATSRRVAQLTMLSWVDRTPDPADRRSHIVRLTSEGHTQLAELSDRRSWELAGWLADWSDEDIRGLARLLSRLRADFDARRSGQHPFADPPEGAHRSRGPAV